MSKVIVLSLEEAAAILKELSAHTLATIYNKEHLLSAITKLNGEGEYLHYPAFAGSHPVEEEPEQGWKMVGDKINIIKLVRHLTSYGLKEAKDFVDARTSGLYNSGTPSVMHLRPSEIGIVCDSRQTFEYYKRQCAKNNVELSN